MNKLSSLAVLQLEQYDTARFRERSKKIDPEVVARIKWSARLRLTYILSYLLGVAGANEVIGFFVRIVERMIWFKTKRKIDQLKQSGMKVVAIAGSYGKTSVKNYTYDLLRHKYRVVATPESFNTVLGIAKCLRWEVDATTDIFIVEVGAYHLGDITYLLQMVMPDIGVLTGIARQHLERFGSFENIRKAKGEIAEYIKATGGKLVANGSDKEVKQVIAAIGLDSVWYRGSGRKEINLDGAEKTAQLLGMSASEVAKIRVREVKNRFEMTSERYGMKVIDDSFSSNDVGFKDAVEYLGKQTKYLRVLVTPGLVELGRESDKIHAELGKAVVGNADLVILVGNNERTKSLAKGIAGKVKIIYIEKTLEFMRIIRDLKPQKEPLVLIENDVTENYN